MFEMILKIVVASATTPFPMIKILLYVLIPLACFGAGVLFASVVWGKYKQLALTLRKSNDDLARREIHLIQTQEQTQSRLLEIETTCRTLEEVLTNLAGERDDLQGSIAAYQADLVNRQAEHDETLKAKQAFIQVKADHESLGNEVKDLKLALTGAENHSASLLQEKHQVLELVNKLQAGVSEVDALRQELNERDAQLAQLKKLRNGNRAKCRAKRLTTVNLTNRRVSKRQRKVRRTSARPASRSLVAQKAASSAPVSKWNGSSIPNRETTPTVASEVIGTNGNVCNSSTIKAKRPGATKRMIGRLFGQSAAANSKLEENTSRRHW